MTGGRAASPPRPDGIREQVREWYGTVASHGGCCGSPLAGTSCCGDLATSLDLGYASEEIAGLPPGADLGLGCGSPTRLVALRAGDVVLDLGSGAGIDCFLAAKKVGPRGRVIGVDMTPGMLSRARAGARAGGYRTVEFRLGEMEHLPVPNGAVDVVISNCAVNLSPDKRSVYAEAYRVLRPGGRLAVSDVIATRPIGRIDRDDPAQWCSCSSGALGAGPTRTLLREVGFVDVRVDLPPAAARAAPRSPPASLGALPASIRATKPGK